MEAILPVYRIFLSGTETDVITFLSTKTFSNLIFSFVFILTSAVTSKVINPTGLLLIGCLRVCATSLLTYMAFDPHTRTAGSDTVARKRYGVVPFFGFGPRTIRW